MAEATPEQKRHLARIRANIVEMRKSLKESEKARDKYYHIRNAYRDDGLSGFTLDKACQDNYDAKGAIGDSQLYDRWATKYGAIVSAEAEAYRLGIHADSWEKE